MVALRSRIPTTLLLRLRLRLLLLLLLVLLLLLLPVEPHEAVAEVSRIGNV